MVHVKKKILKERVKMDSWAVGIKWRSVMLKHLFGIFQRMKS